MKLFRASGDPINPEHVVEQKKILNQVMDKLEAEHGRCTQENSKIFTEALEATHRAFIEVHPISVPFTYPRSQKELASICKKFGAIAFCIEDGKMVGYIMDTN